MTGSLARPKRLLAPLAVITINLLAVGCTPPAAPTSNAPVAANSNGNTTAAATPEQAPASFINKVWRVRESSGVAPGTLYVFLSEGTLVVTSPNSKPALGTWKQEGGGAFTMTEEGVAYKTDVLNLSANEFKIRSNNPGRAVDTTLIPAEGSFPTP